MKIFKKSEKEITVDFNYVYKVIIKGRKYGLLVSILVLTMAILYAQIAKPLYEVRVVMLPPAQQSSPSGMLAALGGLTALTGQSVGIKDPNALYVSLIQSKRLHIQLAERLSLKKDFDVNTAKEAGLRIGANIKVSSDKDNGFITISYRDTDTNRMCKITNGIVDELRNFVKQMSLNDASQKRLFIEKQWSDAKDKLANSEVELNSMQKKTGVIEIETQSKGTLDAISTLQKDITERLAKLNALKISFTENSQEIITLKTEIDYLKSRMMEMNRGNEDNGMISKNKVPRLSLEYTRLIRNVKYYEALFEILSKQYEMAKIDEAKEVTSINVLEDASLNGFNKIKPKKGIIIVMGCVLACLLGLIVSLIVGLLLTNNRKDEVLS